MDPLRPFLSLVRSLWTSSASAKTANRAQGARPPHAGERTTEAEPSQPVERRLQAHLTPLTKPGAWNAQRAREVFVRQVLLHELGEELAADAAFAELIQKVSGQLGGDPKISERLDQLLRKLAAERHS
jgi:hypothetical protein